MLPFSKFSLPALSSPVPSFAHTTSRTFLPPPFSLASLPTPHPWILPLHSERCYSAIYGCTCLQLACLHGAKARIGSVCTFGTQWHRVCLLVFGSTCAVNSVAESPGSKHCCVPVRKGGFCPSSPDLHHMPSAPAAYISNLWPLSPFHLVASDSHEKKKGHRKERQPNISLNKETESPLGSCKQQRKQHVVTGKPENPKGCKKKEDSNGL